MTKLNNIEPLYWNTQLNKSKHSQYKTQLNNNPLQHPTKNEMQMASDPALWQVVKDYYWSYKCNYVRGIRY